MFGLILRGSYNAAGAGSYRLPAALAWSSTGLDSRGTPRGPNRMGSDSPPGATPINGFPFLARDGLPGERTGLTEPLYAGTCSGMGFPVAARGVLGRGPTDARANVYRRAEHRTEAPGRGLGHATQNTMRRSGADTAPHGPGDTGHLAGVAQVVEP